MKLRYRLFQRGNGIFFIEDRVTRKQASLQTRDKAAAQRIFNAKNESHQQPAINLQIARAYLMAIDPLVAKRSWQHVMGEIVKFKKGATLQRWQTAVKDKAVISTNNHAGFYCLLGGKKSGRSGGSPRVYAHI